MLTFLVVTKHTTGGYNYYNHYAVRADDQYAASAKLVASQQMRSGEDIIRTTQMNRLEDVSHISTVVYRT